MIEIIRKENCCGCGVCKSVCPNQAISLVKDEEGFTYPSINKADCIDCELCKASCPILHRDNNDVNNTPLNVYAAHAKDNTIWFTSSSGGIFQVLASYVLDRGGIICGALYDENFKVLHGRVSSSNEIEKLKGSKYVQSDTEGIFLKVREDLENGKLVLFSGTPCQVEGLKLFLRAPFTNLITCDIVCHCVPSPKVFADYISYLQNKYKSRISGINMKDKTLGWGKQTLRIRFANGKEIFNNADSNLWNSLFYSRLICRPSCFECRFTNINRPGDLTIGDFWGIEKTHPEIMDNKGVSLIYVNSIIGKDVLGNIYDKLELTECRLEDSIQENLNHPVAINPMQEKFWQDYKDSPFDRIATKYFNNERYTFINLIKKAMRLLKGIGKTLISSLS